MNDLFQQEPVEKYLVCRDCGADIDLEDMFLRDGLCVDCEWGPEEP